MRSAEAARPMRDAVDEAAARRLRRAAQRRWSWFAIVAVLAFAADQVTKLVVRATLQPGERIHVLPGFQFVRGRNEGIAFGLFPGNAGFVAALTAVALVIIAFALARIARSSTIAAVGGGMLIGGSIGNLVDRLVHGGVTDFLDPARWPAFNVADAAIMIGAALVAIGMLRMRPDDAEG